MSTIKVNTITTRSGSTITLGESGKTITLACGASQTGFGRTGTVDWCTTAKTSPFTGVSGKGYFINTSGGAVTVTLPASPSAGDIISIADYTNTFQTNAVTVGRNSSKIGGVCADATLNTKGQSVTLVYVDGTEGWKNVQDSTSNVTGISHVTASGGTETTCGDYKIHTFTSDGNFIVSNAGQPGGSNTVDYLVVAGGGGGGHDNGAGGGGGGFRLSNSTSMPSPLTSPLATPTALPVSATTYPISVGAGGSGGTGPSGGCNGSNSVFSSITSAGGGKGGEQGGDGGSGGGNCSASPSTRGAGNTPPVSPPQGNDGGLRPGNAPAYAGGGGGGAGAQGANSTGPKGGAGGDGSYVLGTGFAGSNGTTGPVSDARYFSGGGGGGGQPYSPACSASNDGGAGGGGNAYAPAFAGGTNTGGGGGGGTNPATGGAGGSGIVIIRYKYQN
jgi:hypothetical protein